MAVFGVTSVSVLAYALSLTISFSVRVMTVVTNVLYAIIQTIIMKRFDLREFIVQLILAVLFGFFIQLTFMIVQNLLPAPSNIVIQIAYLISSLFICAVGLLFYFTPKLPLMPYDSLLIAVCECFRWKMGKAKIICDTINVIISAVVCLSFIHHLGSIGIGTFFVAGLIGKILGVLIEKFQQPLHRWIYKSNLSRKNVNVFLEKN